MDLTEEEKSHLESLKFGPAYRTIMALADGLVTEQKAEAFKTDDDRKFIKAKGAEEFLKTLKDEIKPYLIPAALRNR
jgi:hypothetical protein